MPWQGRQAVSAITFIVFQKFIISDRGTPIHYAITVVINTITKFLSTRVGGVIIDELSFVMYLISSIIISGAV